MKRSNERSEIIAPGGTWGMQKNGSTLKGLNVNRSFVFNQIGKCYIQTKQIEVLTAQLSRFA
jgi:hypothetical protein